MKRLLDLSHSSNANINWTFGHTHYMKFFVMRTKSQDQNRWHEQSSHHTENIHERNLILHTLSMTLRLSIQWICIIIISQHRLLTRFRYFNCELTNIAYVVWIQRFDSCPIYRNRKFWIQIYSFLNEIEDKLLCIERMKRGNRCIQIKRFFQLRK